METVDLKLDEKNELEFKLEIESPEQSSPPKARLMCECEGLSYVFDGEITSEGEVKVKVPSMKGRLSEGKHKAQLEVFIDNKYFVPLEFQANFKESVKVMAEIKTRTSKTQGVKAAIVSKPVSKPVVNEERASAKTTLKEKAAKNKLAKEKAAKKKKLIEAKRRAIAKKKLEEQKRKEAARKKAEADPDELLRDLLGDLGISDD